MNIFMLDVRPDRAAQFHCDKHVVKMVVESAQLLSTATHVLGGNTEGIYRRTHENHPCAVWVRKSFTNYIWTWELFQSLCNEYQHRYGKIHKTSRLLDVLYPQNIRSFIPDIGFTPPALAMPSKYHSPSFVASYRQYYIGEKLHILSYKERDWPWWIKERP